MQLWIKSLKTFRWKLLSKVMGLFILEKLQDRIIWQNLKNFVDNLNNFDYTIKGIEAWLSLVERCVRDAEAASSNLVASMYFAVYTMDSGLMVKRSRRRPLTA